MNILLLTPGINRKFNDNYFAYSHIAEKGNRILALSNRENILKGSRAEVSPAQEQDGRIMIHRVFETLKEQRGLLKAETYAVIKKLAADFKPEVIFCENSINMPLATRLKKDFGIPLVLRVEDFYDSRDPYDIIGHKKFLQNPVTGDMLGRLVGPFVWRRFCRVSDALITHNPKNKQQVEAMRAKGRLAKCVAWPGKEVVFSEAIPKVKGRACFIGSFDRHKNLGQLRRTIPELLARTPLKEFHIIGDGHDAGVVRDLVRLFPGKIIHRKTMSREECLRLIAGSYFCHTTALIGAWGFIGDSWAMKTPLVATNNYYDFNDGVDAVVAAPEAIAVKVNRLYTEPEFCQRIIEEGYKRFQACHRADVVGQEYLSLCQAAVAGVGKRV